MLWLVALQAPLHHWMFGGSSCWVASPCNAQQSSVWVRLASHHAHMTAYLVRCVVTDGYFFILCIIFPSQPSLVEFLLDFNYIFYQYLLVMIFICHWNSSFSVTGAWVSYRCGELLTELQAVPAMFSILHLVCRARVMGLFKWFYNKQQRQQQHWEHSS